MLSCGGACRWATTSYRMVIAVLLVGYATETVVATGKRSERAEVSTPGAAWWGVVVWARRGACDVCGYQFGGRKALVVITVGVVMVHVRPSVHRCGCY